jgi:hypothetical protein
MRVWGHCQLYCSPKNPNDSPGSVSSEPVRARGGSCGNAGLGPVALSKQHKRSDRAGRALSVERASVSVS